MDKDIAIEVKNVKKSFKVFLDRGFTLQENVLFKKRRRYERREVLNDISFSVKKGEALGLVGHNGCGKSTTLKLLTRIMYPDSGTVQIAGRVSSLIELGAGFHPDMSGRENIYINASIFGLTKKEIDRRLDDIIAFSELESFIDNPVRTYSSGMYMRLAFAVAINVDADVLLIDEILAVGDAAFQAKCFDRIREIKASGTTIVLVSHSLEQVEQICDRSIWINNGLIMADDSPKQVHLQYMDFMNRRQTEQSDDHPGEQLASFDTVRRYGNQKAVMTKIRLLNKDNEEAASFSCGEPCRLEISYEVKEPVRDAVFGFGIYRNDMFWIYGTNTRIDRHERFDLEGSGTFTIEIDALNLIRGSYWFDITIEEGLGVPVDFYKEAVHFNVLSTVFDVGVVRFNHSWDYENMKILQ